MWAIVTSQGDVGKCIRCLLQSSNPHPIELICNHIFCTTKFKEYVWKELSKGISIFGIGCPKCQRLIDEFRMESLLGNDEYQQYIKKQEKLEKRQEKLEKNAKMAQIEGEHEIARNNSPELKCPKCKVNAPHFVINDNATCLNPGCEYIYCLKCRKAGHDGFCENKVETPATPPPKSLGFNHPVLKNQFETFKQQHILHQRPEKGAVALQKSKMPESEQDFQFYWMVKEPKPKRDDSQMRTYEENFYEAAQKETVPQSDSNEITRAQIANAFSHEVDLPWPWDHPQSQSDLEFISPFESLNPKRWIEDELIEKAIKVYMQGLWGSQGCALLESFLFRWGLTHNNVQFINAIQEKDLFSREVVVSLMNSDLSGSGGHWILGVIDLRAFTIVLLDSSRVDSIPYYENFFFYLLHALYVASNFANVRFNAGDWDLCILADAAQQTNSYDCGAMSLANLVALTSKRELNFSPDGTVLRRWIYNILKSGAHIPMENNSHHRMRYGQSPFSFEPKHLKIRRVCQNCILPKLFKRENVRDAYNDLMALSIT